MSYTESYYSLSHGTDQLSAERIISEGFLVKGDANSWCGKGVYFYDIKKDIVKKYAYLLLCKSSK